MTQPPPYTRQFSFTDFSTSNPVDPHPGTSLDQEFNAILATLRVALANLALIQRDDGALRNGSVGVDTLSAAALQILGASSQWSLRGVWAVGVSYAVSDVVSSGTITAVCAVAHTSTASFLNDLDDGNWIVLFNSSGSTPGDGVVTTAKLADGAVTQAKIGATTLTLQSYLATTGFAAGNAPLGSLFHARKATGDVIIKIERTTNDQGVIGIELIGSTTWTLEQPSASTSARLRHSVFGPSTIWTALGTMEQPGTIRSTGAAVPASGAGVQLRYASNIGRLESYDYGASLWRELRAMGQTVALYAANVKVMEATATGVDVTGLFTINGIDHRDIAQNAQAGGYTLALADRGKHIAVTASVATALTIPTNASAAFPVGSSVAVINTGTGICTLTPASGVTLVFAGAGSTGSRALAAKGLATLIKTGSDTWYVSGVGLT